jgi:hypothetical protein
MLDGDACVRCEESGVEAAALEVVQTLQRAGGALRFVPPKTEDSKRTVPPPGPCITACCEHKLARQRSRSLAGARACLLLPHRDVHGAGQPSP